MKISRHEARQILDAVHELVADSLDDSIEPMDLFNLGAVFAGGILTVVGGRAAGDVLEIAAQESELADGIDDGMRHYAETYGITTGPRRASYAGNVLN
jgi:hypothetical protein